MKQFKCASCRGCFPIQQMEQCHNCEVLSCYQCLNEGKAIFCECGEYHCKACFIPVASDRKNACVDCFVNEKMTSLQAWINERKDGTSLDKCIICLETCVQSIKTCSTCKESVMHEECVWKYSKKERKCPICKKEWH